MLILFHANCLHVNNDNTDKICVVVNSNNQNMEYMQARC